MQLTPKYFGNKTAVWDINTINMEKCSWLLAFSEGSMGIVFSGGTASTLWFGTFKDGRQEKEGDSGKAKPGGGGAQLAGGEE